MTKSDLRTAGLSATQVRIVLLDALREAGTPLSADDLGNRLAAQGHHAGRASLFRNLTAFTKSGLAERIETDERGSRYIACERGHHEHHHHIICQQCHHTESVRICLNPAQLHQIETNTNYRITGHSLTLYGLCKICMRRKK